jgi:hypothetical protein
MWGAGCVMAECLRDPPTPLFESRGAHEDGNQLGLILSSMPSISLCRFFPFWNPANPTSLQNHRYPRPHHLAFGHQTPHPALRDVYQVPSGTMEDTHP